MIDDPNDPPDDKLDHLDWLLERGYISRREYGRRLRDLDGVDCDDDTGDCHGEWVDYANHE